MKGDMHNQQGLSPSLLWEALTGYDLWPIYLLGVSWMIPPTPASSCTYIVFPSLSTLEIATYSKRDS